MKDILLSIVIPVYNVELYLDRCVQSCKKYLNENVEILLIDDGSTDSCSYLCDNYFIDNIKVFHKENGGLSDARNFGLDRATGKYVWFVDSDDVIYPIWDGIKQCIEMEPDIISMNYCIVKGNKKQYVSHNFKGGKRIYTGCDFLKESLRIHKYFVPVWSYIYRREYLVDNCFYFRKGLVHEDEQLMPYLLLNAKSILKYEEFGYEYIIRENSIATSKNSKKNVIDLFTIYRENEIYFNEQITDDDLKKMLLNDISEKVMYISSRYSVSNVEVSEQYELKNVITYSYSLKNKIKAFIFVYFRPLYSLLFKLNERGK